MSGISQKHFEEFLKISEERGIKYIDEVDARDAAQRLIDLADLMLDFAIEDHKRKLRLKKEPKGYHFDDGKYYTCLICHDSICNEQLWYDSLGIKCMNCQKAYEDGVLPESVFKDRDSWVSDWRIKSDYKLHPATLRKLIRDGKLRPRTVKNQNGTDHYYVFLLSENSELLKHLPTDNKGLG